MYNVTLGRKGVFLDSKALAWKKRTDCSFNEMGGVRKRRGDVEKVQKREWKQEAINVQTGKGGINAGGI